MRKTISFLYLLFIMKIMAWGQQDPLFTNNMFYKLGVNPGYAGSKNGLNGILLNRYQWKGMKNAPKTLVFSVDAAINIFNRPGGLGLNLISDNLGFSKNILINANYAYKTTLSIGNLGVGISLGLYNQKINGNWTVPDDPVFTPPKSDLAIPQGELSQVAFDIGSGVYLSAKQYYLGFSLTHINKPTIKFNDNAGLSLSPHYYFMGGYNIRLSDPLFEVRPSFFFRTDLAGWQMDINTNVVYDNRFWGGLSYRVNDAVALLLGFELTNGLKVGYSFDLVTSSIGYYGFSSHELFVSYSIYLDRNRNQKYKSIRFL